MEDVQMDVNNKLVAEDGYIDNSNQFGSLVIIIESEIKRLCKIGFPGAFRKGSALRHALTRVKEKEINDPEDFLSCKLSGYPSINDILEERMLR
jgi:hypothetical protein